MSQVTTSERAVVARDGVIIWVQVFASEIWGIPLEGCIVGAGCAWHWHSIATACVVGGFIIIASCSARWPCHWWVAHDFMDAGFTDGGMHIWGWWVTESKRGVDDHSLGNLLLTLCSHHWGGLGGQAWSSVCHERVREDYLHVSSDPHRILIWNQDVAGTSKEDAIIPWFQPGGKTRLHLMCYTHR